MVKLMTKQTPAMAIAVKMTAILVRRRAIKEIRTKSKINFLLDDNCHDILGLVC